MTYRPEISRDNARSRVYLRNKSVIESLVLIFVASGITKYAGAINPVITAVVGVTMNP
jgi:hypothetical protein